MDADILSPKQRRSAERLDAILSAAELLIAREGAAALTMRAVGRASCTPQGSLYQYVPSTEAILRALAERYAARIEDTLARSLSRLGEADALTPDALVDAILPDLAETFASLPAYHELRLALARDAAAIGLEDRLDRAIISLLAPAVAHLNGGALAHDAERVVRVLIEIGDALLSRSEQTGEHNQVVQDVRCAMIGYLRMLTNDSGPYSERKQRAPRRDSPCRN